jgi:hypothetical protein
MFAETAPSRAAAQPIYWAGPKHGTYELTRTTDGRTYKRRTRRGGLPRGATGIWPATG